MPAFSKERKQEYLSLIRHINAIDPDITIKGVQEQLHKHGIEMHYETVWGLCKKINAERAHRADKVLAAVEVAKYEDLVKATMRTLWNKILTSGGSLTGTAIALKELREAARSVIDMKFDAGILDKKLGTLQVLDNVNFSTMTIEEVNKAFEQWFNTPAPPDIDFVEAQVIADSTNNTNQNEQNGDNRQPKSIPEPAKTEPVLPGAGTVTRRY